MTLKESLLPSSEKEVGILDKALREINEKNYISNEDFLKLCDEDVLLSKRLWNCLIETEAARISKYRPEILNGTEYALKYLETDYFKRAYEEEVIKRNRDTLELEKLSISHEHQEVEL